MEKSTNIQKIKLKNIFKKLAKKSSETTENFEIMGKNFTKFRGNFRKKFYKTLWRKLERTLKERLKTFWKKFSTFKVDN